ncbi:MAG: ParB/RepB/Spo0J family partition protein, partial [Bacteroidales bacterium]|nr:ParB/RepB/Spo0J family partition protein [Bacteroidales bacterium]
MAKQKALGMGLQALIASASTSAGHPSEASGTEEVRLDLLDVNPYQPRNAFDEDALEALAASIRQLGLIQPISVCRTGDGRYRIISGERRFRAARLAGLQTVPVYVRPGEENRHMLLMALEENLQREDLDAIEIALAYRRLIDEFHYTQEELSAVVSKKRSTVANFLRLLKLPPEVQFAIRRKAVSMGHARALVNVQDPDVQLQLLNEIIEK